MIINKELRKFGFSLGLGLNILGCILFYRHRNHFIWFSTIGSMVLIAAIIYPKILIPVKKILDKLIFFIGWFTGIITMLIVFYLIFTPLAILIKIMRKDPLNQKIYKKASTYWIRRKTTPFSKEYYDRMG